MSMVICETCDRLIDSDDDLDCFIEVGNMKRWHKTEVMCEVCREKLLDDQEYQESMTP